MEAVEVPPHVYSAASHTRSDPSERGPKRRGRLRRDHRVRIDLDRRHEVSRLKPSRTVAIVFARMPRPLLEYQHTPAGRGEPPRQCPTPRTASDHHRVIHATRLSRRT